MLQQYNISENPKETARYALNVCDACKGIIENYGYSQEAWEMGKHVTDEVKVVEEYVQNSQKKFFNDCYDYFHQDIEKVVGNILNENND